MINKRLLGSEFYDRISWIVYARGYSVNEMGPLIGMTGSGFNQALKRNSLSWKHLLNLCEFLDLMPSDGIFEAIINAVPVNLEKDEKAQMAQTKYMAQKKKADALRKRATELTAKVAALERQLNEKKGGESAN